jgi:tripartite-type tricarboxylate transporter receptor subunit TctC
MKKLLIVLTSLFLTVAQATPINIVVPVPVGGALDIMARDLSLMLTDKGIENIVTNHPGGDGEIARDFVSKTKDNVIMIGGNTHWIVTDFINHRENRYLNNMVIVGPIFFSPYTFMTGSNSYQSLDQLIQASKKQPVNCGTVTAKSRLDLLLMNHEYGTKFIPIPYKGTVNVVPDVISGAINCVYNSVGGIIPLVKSGRIKVLGGNQPIAIESMVDKTLFPNVYMRQWIGFSVPSQGNLAKDQVIMDILNNFTQQPEKIKASLDSGYFIATPSKNTKKLLEDELKQLSKLNIDEQ